MMKKIILLLACINILACGVKSDPLPPIAPAEIGRGRPTFKRAFDKVNLPGQKPAKDDDEDTDNDEE
jgi:hypothetical protein